MTVQIILMTALAVIIIILTNDHYLLFLAEINIKQQDGFKLRKLFSCQFSWSSFILWVNYKTENINTEAFSYVKLFNVSYLTTWYMENNLLNKLYKHISIEW